MLKCQNSTRCRGPENKKPQLLCWGLNFFSVCCYGILTFHGLSCESELGNKTFTILKAIRANNPYANTKHKMIKRRFMGVWFSLYKEKLMPPQNHCCTQRPELGPMNQKKGQMNNENEAFHAKHNYLCNCQAHAVG